MPVCNPEPSEPVTPRVATAKAPFRRAAVALASVTDEDATLVKRARNGDRRAFEELVDRHRAVVFRVAARVVGPHEADDVSQDALLRAYHRLDGYRGEGSFRAWLLRIVHNTALNHLERRLPEPVGGSGDIERAVPVREGSREPASRLERRERAERLEAKLRGLRPEHRVVLVLRDLEGMAYEEIALITESPLGSVKGRLHRARNELVEILRANTYDWELPQ
jgi:RNA polymerase sigma-70 factor (ECF subfamily)